MIHTDRWTREPCFAFPPFWVYRSCCPRAFSLYLDSFKAVASSLSAHIGKNEQVSVSCWQKFFKLFWSSVKFSLLILKGNVWRSAKRLSWVYSKKNLREPIALNLWNTGCPSYDFCEKLWFPSHLRTKVKCQGPAQDWRICVWKLGLELILRVLLEKV